MTHICICNLTIIGSDNGLSPSRRQAIIWTKTGILLIRPLRTNFSEIWSEIYTFSLKKMHLKRSGKWLPFCLGLNVLNNLEASQDSQSCTTRIASVWEATGGLPTMQIFASTAGYHSQPSAPTSSPARHQMTANANGLTHKAMLCFVG